MVENIRLSTAMRRNRQKRDLAIFLDDCHSSTGLTISEDDIIDAQASIIIERRLYASVEQSVKDGTLERIGELGWDQVEEYLNEHSSQFQSDVLCIFLCHYSDFAFRLPIDSFLSYAKALVHFDGDSVYAVLESLDHGVGIDMYESEVVHETRYSVDLW